MNFFFNFKPAQWKTLEYTRGEVIRAGKSIRKNSFESPLEKARCIQIIDNWRAAHAYPLHVFYMHLRKMVKGCVVAQRLKRLDSIVGKLNREPSMSLWTMQDLGGCRIIVPTVDDVYQTYWQYETSRKRHLKKSECDYIKTPKKTGYRCLHVVYEFRSDRKSTYNKNFLIEIQIRTQLQHMWATAVETMGLFTKQAIKSGQGSDSVKRFFLLVSALFAEKEKQPAVPGTPETHQEIIDELKILDDKFHFLDNLSAFRVAVNAKCDKQSRLAGYYLLILKYDKRLLNINYFKPSEIDKANRRYAQVEEAKSDKNVDAVLVRVNSFGILKNAYPNYFSDIGEFVKVVSDYLKKD